MLLQEGERTAELLGLSSGPVHPVVVAVPEETPEDTSLLLVDRYVDRDSDALRSFGLELRHHSLEISLGLSVVEVAGDLNVGPQLLLDLFEVGLQFLAERSGVRADLD
ncbi:hypothetical protein [Mycolicibacterium hassiacum]|uniref:hypothetical protein n=1 Tax=Mycolicibacterium hassiacum TaxID=46351 RepID=UPI001930D540|nr:hypothetical protein [Mycolicibacterium hassiacum]